MEEMVGAVQEKVLFWGWDYQYIARTYDHLLPSHHQVSWEHVFIVRLQVALQDLV